MNDLMHTRRAFLRNLGLSASAAPFLSQLPYLGASPVVKAAPKQRLVIVFSPNGTIPKHFWPDQQGNDFELKRILKPLEPFQDRLLTLRGVCNKIGGDGDRHMRGMSCLLTGIELFPGNIQGGSDTPAGWAKGISIDQELKNHFQANNKTRTRFGSLNLGVGVTDRADPWTRMSYAGPNQPVAPIDDPYQAYRKLYGKGRERKSVHGILDDVRADLAQIAPRLAPNDRHLLEQHAKLVSRMEKDLATDSNASLQAPPPELPAGITNQNDNLPTLARMQSDMLVNTFVNDFARVATLQFTKSVGQAKMNWLEIEKGHHSLSHEPDGNADAVADLTKINTWFAGEVANLAKKLADTPEPGGTGCLLDNTLIVWTNELGKGNNHTLNDVPFVLIGSGWGFRMGRSLRLPGVPHNRLLLSLAHAAGHPIETFGNPKLSARGPLDLG